MTREEWTKFALLWINGGEITKQEMEQQSQELIERGVLNDKCR